MRGIGVGIALLCGCLAGCGDPEAAHHHASAIPQTDTLGRAPTFSLLDQSAAPFGSERLEGRYWVADFIFTRCTSMCPMLSNRMRELQTRLANDSAGDGVHLVSFSVDPEHDRPPVLADYAARYGADPERWSFLTGGREEIWDLSTSGFKLAVGEAPPDSEEPLFHSDRFVLVDPAGEIRGYYSATRSEGLDALVADLRQLVGRDGSG